jgi:hypothetical protein
LAGILFLKEPTMRSIATVSCFAAFSLAFTVSVSLLSPTLAAGTRTSKERLSDKASDEQRVDNCRVPIERRGRTPRPDCRKDPDAAGSMGTDGGSH